MSFAALEKQLVRYHGREAVEFHSKTKSMASDKITKNRLAFPLSQTMTAAVIAYGVFIRLYGYISNHSLWLDEAMLAVDVVFASFHQLVTQPLIYDQRAPIGFLLLTKFETTIFGNSEYVLRMIPFLAGAASFVLFFKLLKRYTDELGTLIALVMFSFSPGLIRYAAEFKPYSSDVLIALIILLFGISLSEKKFNLKQASQLGMMGAVAVWLSFPSVFILGGVGSGLFFLFLSKKQWQQIGNLFISLIYWAISFSVHYFIFLKPLENVELEKFWAGFFARLPPASLHDHIWNFSLMMGMFRYPGSIQIPLCGFIAFVIGGFLIFRKNRTVFLMLITPLFLAMVVSGIHKYPFGGRAFLFYIPIIYLFIAEGLAVLLKRHLFMTKLSGAILMCAILFFPIVTISKNFPPQMNYTEEIKPVLQYITEHIQKGDAIYVYYGANPAFDYYAQTYDFDKYVYFKGVGSRGDLEAYKTDLSWFIKKKRGWIIFSHIYRNEMKDIITYLNTVGVQKDAVGSTNAAAFMYQFDNDLS